MTVSVHTSIAGGLENVRQKARRIGCDTFQVFSANPRGWKGLEPELEACERFRERGTRHPQSPVVVPGDDRRNLKTTRTLAGANGKRR